MDSTVNPGKAQYGKYRICFNPSIPFAVSSDGLTAMATTGATNYGAAIAARHLETVNVLFAIVTSNR